MIVGWMRWFVPLLGLLVLAGCEKPTMREMTLYPHEMKPYQDKAGLVIIRPEVLGDASSAKILDITSGPPLLVGILGPGEKLFVMTTPGKHAYMVLSHRQDFMETNKASFLSADLAMGKTYFAYVESGLAGSQSVFRLRPIKRDEQKGVRFKTRLEERGRWVAKTPRAEMWLALNEIRVKQIQVRDYPVDLHYNPDRPRLLPEDGR